MWLLIMVIYVAPPDAVNWQGSWELGMTKLVERRFSSEATCRSAGREIKDRLNQGMLAPVRFHCLNISSELPAGAPR